LVHAGFESIAELAKDTSTWFASCAFALLSASQRCSWLHHQPEEAAVSTVLQDPVNELRVAVRQDDAVRCALCQVLKQLLHACCVWKAAQHLLQRWRSNAFSMQVCKHLQNCKE
jgi:hypothetical protein